MKRLKLCPICKEEYSSCYVAPPSGPDRLAFLVRMHLEQERIEQLQQVKQLPICHRHFHPDGLAVVNGLMKIVDSRFLLVSIHLLIPCITLALAQN